MTKKPLKEAHVWIIEATPANDFQEEMMLESIQWVLKVIALQLESRHKSNKVRLKYMPIEHK